MNEYSLGELFIIYGFLSLIVAIGILFLLQGCFFRKGFYKKYTLHTTAEVKGYIGCQRKATVCIYETILDGEVITLVERSSIGIPFYIPEVGDVVDVYIHPDPNKMVSLALPAGTKTRAFGCEKRFLSMSRFYSGIGLTFFGAGLTGIIMFTITRMQ